MMMKMMMIGDDNNDEDDDDGDNAYHNEAIKEKLKMFYNLPLPRNPSRQVVKLSYQRKRSREREENEDDD